MRLRSPSGVKRGRRKHETPPSVCASTRKTSHIGAEQNHLWPVSSYSAPPPPPFSGRAIVVFERTSEPPWRSVIAMPHSAPAFCSDGIMRLSYSSDVSRGSHSSASSGCLRSAGTQAYVIEIGQPWPDSTAEPLSISAARAACAPRRGSIHGSAWVPCFTDISISQCHAGWNSTSSIRLPKRSWVFSCGGFSLASRPHSSGSPPPPPPSPTPLSPPPPAEPHQLLLGPVGALAARGLGEGAVLEVHVVAAQRRRLVEDLACGVGADGCAHATSALAVSGMAFRQNWTSVAIRASWPLP